MVLTAGSDDVLESELLAMGCDAVVFKPVGVRELMDRVVALLERGPRTVTDSGLKAHGSGTT